MLVENLPSPFDRRVWQEACALRDAGYVVSIICPTGAGCEKRFEAIDSIHIHRYSLPVEASGAVGYALEYGAALAVDIRARLARAPHARLRRHPRLQPARPVLPRRPVVQAAREEVRVRPPRSRPELYEAKFGRRDFFYRLMLKLERWTFRSADVSIATNESYKRIAIERGRMAPERVFVVRSGPSLGRLKILPPDERLKREPSLSRRLRRASWAGRRGSTTCCSAARHIVLELGRSDVHFGLVGGGTSLEEMKALAVELGVADHVTFTGRVPDAEMLAMLNTAEVCVNPDVANDMNDKSTMNKIMEYMALGKPIVQFDLTEGRWSARRASLYARRNDPVDLAAKIVELLDDPARRAEMGEYGRRRVEDELEWRHEAPKLLAAYAALGRGAAPRARRLWLET